MGGGASADETSRRLDAFLRAVSSFTFQPFDTRVDRSKRGRLHFGGGSVEE